MKKYLIIEHCNGCPFFYSDDGYARCLNPYLGDPDGRSLEFDFDEWGFMKLVEIPEWCPLSDIRNIRFFLDKFVKIYYNSKIK